MLPILAPHSLTVWLADLDQFASETGGGWLSDEEQARAGRFRRAIDQRRFRVGRGLLRWLIGGAIECDPAAVQFDYSPHGKPSHRLIHFNVAHAENLWACGLSWDVPLGVDVEKLGPIEARQQALSAFLGWPDESDAGFLRRWTAQEAYGKALGVGLLKGLTNKEAYWRHHFEFSGAIGAVVSEKSPEVLCFMTLKNRLLSQTVTYL